jgi:hypothetical protein
MARQTAPAFFNTVQTRRAAAFKRGEIRKSGPSSLATLLVCVLGLIVGLSLTRPAKADLVTWDLVNVVMGSFKFTGTFTADATTGLVQSTHIYDQYFNDTPVTLFSDAGAVIRTDLSNNLKLVVETGSAETAIVGFHQVTLLLNPGEKFSDTSPTLTLNGTSSERTTGCCDYLTSGSLANEAFAVPEPLSLTLFGIGAGALGMVRRRRA